MDCYGTLLVWLGSDWTEQRRRRELRSAMPGLPTLALEYVGHLRPLDATCMRASVEISFGKPATTNSSAECSPSRLLLTATLR
jgi:hypothetical protein